MTFSALIDVLTQPSHRLISILSAQKHPRPGPVFGYKKAKEQLVDWVLTGSQLDPTATNLREHESDAILAAAGSFTTRLALLPAGSTSATKPGVEPQWSVNGVEISVYPDLLVAGTVKKTQATGAVKLYLRKDATIVGPQLASLIYYHRSQILNDPNVDPALCAITDVQAGVVHAATGNYARLLAQVQSACQLINAVWPTI